MLDVNEYFNGKVKSISLQTATLPATMGVMTPGEYTFTTDCKEIIDIVSGELDVQLPGCDWVTYAEGQVFEVEAQQSFHLKVNRDVAYLCKYVR